MRPSDDFDRVVFDDHVGEQSLARLAQLRPRGGAVLAIDLDVENLALADAFDPVDAERP